MSNALPIRPRPLAHRRSYAIVASRYNIDYVRGLVENARQELLTITPRSNIIIYEVPGAFEIPLVVQEAAATGQFEVIIALGVIIQGETGHAEMVARSVTDALQQCALKSRIPVIHEVLLVADENQAHERCIAPELNRGIEAARAAAEIAQVMSEIKPRQ